MGLCEKKRSNELIVDHVVGKSSSCKTCRWISKFENQFVLVTQYIEERVKKLNLPQLHESDKNNDKNEAVAQL